MTVKKYETRPLESWTKAKELREQHYRDVWEAKGKGKLLITGAESSFLPLPAGLGEYEFLGGEPFSASLSATDPDFTARCQEEAAARGYSENLCSYMRAYCGAMFLDESSPKTMPFFGRFVRPDFALPWAMCEGHGKWFQVVAEYFDIPIFVIDTPLRPQHGDTPNRRKSHIKALVTEFEEAIEWMMKVTGIDYYNDEKLIEAVTNEINATALWAQCCELNKNIPAPLDMKAIYSLYVINSIARHKKDTVEFYRILLDEVKDRVASRIAAVGTERFRVYHDPEPTWHYLKLFRYLAEYGAVCNSSLYSFTVGTAFRRDKNGSWVAAKTLEESGRVLRTRNDALVALAESYVDRPGFMAWYPENKVADTVRIARDWKCDGAILHINRGCTLTAGHLEAGRTLREAGFPVMFYEANMADSRGFDEAGLLNSIDVFMSAQGLKKITE